MTSPHVCEGHATWTPRREDRLATTAPPSLPPDEADPCDAHAEHALHGQLPEADCERCGKPLLPHPRAARSRVPRDYTPRHLAERILSSRNALEGQRKHVTVLFVDVKGSMELADEIDAELLHDIMDRFFAVLSEGIHRFQGTINQFTGDGIMALFGAPIAHEDHGQRACYAALYLNDELRRYSSELKRRLGITFSVRMGLNSGEVVVGSIGDDLRMDYTAQGHTVGLAARMEQLADPGTIYLSEVTAQLVAGFFHMRDLGRFEIKGLRDRVAVFDLQGIGPLRSRFDRSHARGLTTFVGREEEMHVLETALDRAMHGHAQVVGVIAEAGIGKSRLCLEFARSCEGRGIKVRHAHAQAHGQLTPFLPVLDMLRGLFGVEAHEEPAEARKKIAGATLLLEPALVEGLPLLFEFIGVPDPSHAPLPLDPDARQRRLLGIITRLLHAKNRQESSVFILEDLHWLDSSSELFLEKLVESIAGTQTMLLINFRPDYHAPWMNRSYYQQLPLLPLDEDAVALFLRHLLGDDPSVEDLPGTIHERCDGNPFFIEEVVQSLADTGNLEGARETYRLVTPVEHISVPQTVHSVLDARIDQLPDTEKRVLQAAAIIGQRFTEALLLRILDLSEVELTTALQTLTRLEFVYEMALYPSAEFAFVHPLTQEVAYKCQLKEGRTRIHGQVAQALIEMHPDKHDELATLIAHHCEEAGDAMLAADWHQRAAEWIGLRNVNEAYCHWRIVLALIGDGDDSPERVRYGLKARIWLLQLAWRLGLSQGEATRIYNRGMELAQLADDAPSLVMLNLVYAVFRGVVGDHDGHFRYAQQATQLAEELEHAGLSRAARLSMLTALVYRGSLEDALEVASGIDTGPPATDPLHGNDNFFDDDLAQRAFTLGLRGVVRSLAGQLDAAALDVRHAEELVRQVREPETRGYVHAFCVQHAVLAGDVEMALDHGEQAVALAEETEIPLQRADAYLAYADALILAERWLDAIEALDRTREILDQSSNLVSMRPRLFNALALAHHGLGDSARALESAEETLREPGTRAARIIELNARLTRVRALLDTPGHSDPDVVQNELSTVLQLVDKTGAEAYRPMIHLVLAEIARHAGEPETGKEQLGRAHTDYARMGARGHARSVAIQLAEHRTQTAASLA
ncbi:MAG: adenylate/guanylate cyclase domain-containing protein [Myxococcota bacterium]|nr:adenylate/guanylate cyclase domain-containing protein [Myxococcota bacterium]